MNQPNYAIVTEGNNPPFLVGPFDRGASVGDWKSVVERTVEEAEVQICWSDRTMNPIRALAELTSDEN